MRLLRYWFFVFFFFALPDNFAFEYPFSPGVLDRVEIIVETVGSSFGSIITTNVLAPTATFDIKDSTFPNGQTFGIHIPGQPPVQPRLDGSIKFDFPAVTPDRDVSGLFLTPMRASMQFDGSWTRAAEGVSYGAARITMGSLQPTACPIVGPSVVNTGPPVEVGTHAVSLTRTCDMKSLNVLFAQNDPLQSEQAVTCFVNAIAGDGGSGGSAIFLGTSANMNIRVYYKSRRKPEMAVSQATHSFAHKDGDPLPAAQSITLTNTGALPLNWTSTIKTTPAGGTWLKLSASKGTLDGQAKQPIDISVDSAGLTPGDYTATVTLNGNAWNETSKTFLVNFKYTGTPRLTVSPATLELFDDSFVPQTALTLKNEGSAPLIYSAVATSADGWLGTNPKSDLINPKETKTLRVIGSTFPIGFPQLKPGDHTGQITFEQYPGSPNSFVSPPPVTAVFHVGTGANKVTVESVRSSVIAGESEELKISVLKADGKLDTGFSGNVRVSITPESTNGIGILIAGSDSGKTLLLPILNGVQTVLLRTPEKEFSPTVPITPETALGGKAIVRAAVEPAGAGSASAFSSKEIEVKSPVDLRIDRIEAQQGVVQPTGDGFILGRDLLVRVFVEANRGEFNSYLNIQGITATLTVKDESGKVLAGYPLKLDRGAFGSSNVPEKPFVFDPRLENRFTGDASLNHVLAANHPQLTIEAKLDNVYADRDASNDSETLGALTFASPKPVSIWVSRARLKNPAIGETQFPKEDGITRAKQYLHMVYPVTESSFRFVARDDEELDNLPFNKPEFSEAWFWLNRARGADVKAWVYCVDNNFFSYFPLGADRVIAYGLTVNSVAMINSDVCSGETIDFPCGIMAHELGHSFGLGDTYRNVVAVRSATNPRRADATESNIVQDGSFSWWAHRFADSPGKTFLEFMGGGCPVSFYGCKWIDYETWSYLKSKMPPPAVPTPLLHDLAAETYLIVQGSVGKDGTARFGNCYTLSGKNLASASTGNTLMIQILGANSVVLESLGFDPVFRAYDTEFELDSASFSFALPFPGDAREVRLRSAAGVLASRIISTQPPAVSFISDFAGQTLTGQKDVAWTGTDPDGDALTYSLYYSPDGKLQIPLVLETSATNYLWNTDNVPSGSSPILTLVATDGTRASMIDSRPFVLSNRPPRVAIFAPIDQTEFLSGEAVSLEGSFDDPEDGMKANAPVEWSSDRLGLLGTGTTLVTNLPIGTNIITAAVTDSQGLRGNSSLRVIVRDQSVPRLELSNSRLDFGSVRMGETRQLSVLIRNAGNAPLLLNSIASSDDQFVPVAPANFAIPPRSGQTIEIQFVPREGGEQSAILTIQSSDAANANSSITLSGTGVLTARLTAIRSGNQVLLSWPAGLGDYALESALSLESAAKWSAVGGTWPVENNAFKALLNPDGRSAFYRLRKQ